MQTSTKPLFLQLVSARLLQQRVLCGATSKRTIATATLPVRDGSVFFAAAAQRTNTLLQPTATPTATTTSTTAIRSTNTTTRRTKFDRRFHTTAVTSLAERKRRRRRGGGDPAAIGSGGYNNDDNSNSITFEEHSAISNPTEFQEAGDAILEKLLAAVEPMKAKNDPFRVSRRGDIITIEVEPQYGSYVMEVDHEQQVLIFRSPISGSHTYFCSRKTDEWMDTVDHHSFEGLFVRDLIRHCRGVPAI